MPEKKKQTPTNFISTIYGELAPLNNSAFSKARLKVFYKGKNRNGSFINEEIAEKLLSTLPGSPIVGTFEGESDDFLGHMPYETSKPYGFVPETMNFAWEMSLDPDGVYRTYACTDIVLWTGRYPVAAKAVGRSHSMELNPKTIEGQWIETDEDFYYEFTKAEFFGLCILGNDQEPCFEGSSFYELQQDKNFKSISDEMSEMFTSYRLMFNSDDNQTGGQKMDRENEVIAENEQSEVVNTAETVNASNENPAEAITTEEKAETAEQVAEALSEAEVAHENAIEKDEQAQNNESAVVEIETVAEEVQTEDYSTIIAEKDAEIARLNNLVNELETYKHAKLKEEKIILLNQYKDKLTEDEYSSIEDNIDSYESNEELKKEIGLICLDKIEVNHSLVNKMKEYSLAQNQGESLSGVAKIVASHVKK